HAPLASHAATPGPRLARASGGQPAAPAGAHAH
uniref:Uncharacterized protein n=1 Tax=Aegilops tauschii subsp. strangulata TaxID=200361 RepID=A0A453LRI7_AEGTS